jgi:glucan 1,3-beta-glucosidase
MNNTIKAMNLNKHLPIGCSDAGSLLNTYLAGKIDYFMANVHPYFGSLAIQDAAQWTWQFFQWNNVEIAEEASNKPATFIAETGWPTESMDTEHANSGAGSPQGDASVANLQSELTYGPFARIYNTELMHSLPRYVCLPGKREWHALLLL